MSDDTRDRGLLADAQVHLPRHQAVLPQVGDRPLDLPDAAHLPVEAGELGTGSHAHHRLSTSPAWQRAAATVRAEGPRA